MKPRMPRTSAAVISREIATATPRGTTRSSSSTRGITNAVITEPTNIAIRTNVRAPATCPTTHSARPTATMRQAQPPSTRSV